MTFTSAPVDLGLKFTQEEAIKTIKAVLRREYQHKNKIRLLFAGYKGAGKSSTISSIFAVFSPLKLYRERGVIGCGPDHGTRHLVQHEGPFFEGKRIFTTDIMGLTHQEDYYAQVLIDTYSGRMPYELTNRPSTADSVSMSPKNTSHQVVVVVVSPVLGIELEKTARVVSQLRHNSVPYVVVMTHVDEISSQAEYVQKRGVIGEVLGVNPEDILPLRNPQSVERVDDALKLQIYNIMLYVCLKASDYKNSNGLSKLAGRVKYCVVDCWLKNAREAVACAFRNPLVATVLVLLLVNLALWLLFFSYSPLISAAHGSHSYHSDQSVPHQSHTPPSPLSTFTECLAGEFKSCA